MRLTCLARTDLRAAIIASRLGVYGLTLGIWPTLLLYTTMGLTGSRAGLLCRLSPIVDDIDLIPDNDTSVSIRVAVLARSDA